MPTFSTSSQPRPSGNWATIVFGIILVLLGILILAGGAWLIALGGSWYYLLAGIGLIVSGALILAARPIGVLLYILTYVLTAIWAFWEVGLDGWALVPRLVGPTILAVLALLCLIVLGREPSAQSRAEPVEREPAARPPVGHPVPVTRVTGTALLVVFATALAALVGVTLSGGSKAEDQPPSGPVSASAVSGSAVSGKDWRAWGGTDHALRYSTLNQINRDNVGNLKRVWTYRTGDMPDEKAKDKYSPETTPLKLGDRMYLCSAKNIIISLDAATGKEWWRYDPKVSDDAIPYGATCRGVAFYENSSAPPDQLCAQRIIEGTLDARLIAVDAKTGKLCPDFGKGGTVSLTDGIGETVPGWYSNTSAPTIVRNIVVMGAQVQDGQAEDAPSGVIRGYDAVTGKLAWAWDMGHPDRTGAPPAGETYTRGTPNMWTTAAGDDELGYVYVPLGNAAVDYWGTKRKDFENKYNSSLVALDVTSGKPVWSFQTVHYDLWDYDLGSQPTLVDIKQNGTSIPAVVIASKQGDIYVLDRRTGKSLFPVEERKAPTGGVEPDRLSRTQPSSSYHTLAKPPLTEKDMWGMSPLDQLWCRIQFRRENYQGPFTPPTTDGHFLEYPSYNGGNDWGSLSVDPQRGVLIANYNNMANNDRLLPRNEADKLGLFPINVPHKPVKPGRVEYGPQAGAPYAIQINPGWRQLTGLMCTKPPYGGITAIDLATGKTIWDEPLGEARANGPFGIPSMLPITIGTPNNGGSLITAGGLIFIAAATDNMLRAIDIESGKVVWEDKLPAGGQATPMAFEVDGREFIGFMAGGHHFMGTEPGDYVMAYALPDKSAGG
jgi:quinoprotein glucose dehydrogenase